jgi:hypothetical protein
VTDFEDRLTTALRSVGDDAPAGLGLAGAARRRARLRRRRTALASVAAVVAVAGVIGGVAILGQRGGDEGTPSDGGPTPTTSSPTGEPARPRVESWRDLQVTVPGSWGHGALGDWCANGGELGHPVVERPEGVSVDILCDPVNDYGVRFSNGSPVDVDREPGEVWQYDDHSSPEYPVGSWLGYERGSDGNSVLVVTPDRTTTEQVLSSFEHITEADANGCTPHSFGLAPDVAEGTVRLCRYGMDDWLQQSETLTGEDAQKAVDALNAAPTREPSGCPESANLAGVRVRTADLSGMVRVEGCRGVFGWGGKERDLTSDVLYWVLSPGWSGGVAGNVPLPDELRQ